MLTSETGSNEASDGARTEDRGSDVSMGISALRSPRSAHRRTLMPMLTSETGVARGAEPRPGPGREHGDCPKVANRTPPKPEKQADFPLRWSAVLENWRVERAGPLQISSSEHLRTGKTRFRTGAPKKVTPSHRPKANTSPLYIELELERFWKKSCTSPLGTSPPPPHPRIWSRPGGEKEEEARGNNKPALKAGRYFRVRVIWT